MRSPCSLLFSCVNKSSSPVLRPLNCLGSPPLDLLQYVNVFLERKVIKMITSPDLLAMVLLIQPRRLPAFFTARVQCWLLFNLLPNKT